ncbi:MAG: hypothetical protein NTY45_08325 [Elusimicrobia bacterium]|nr:hypothetical protein [Elusimicrobiota bacterium]
MLGKKAVIGDSVNKSTITGTGFEVQNATVATRVLVGTGLNISTITGAGFAGNGSALLNLNATELKSGTVDNARLTTAVTLKGNDFNGSNQLVLLDENGKLPLGVGAIHRSVEGSNGTLGAGTKFFNLVPTGAIQLTKMTVTILSAGEGTGDTVWECGDGTNKLTVTTSPSTVVGEATSSTDGPASISAGTAVYGQITSSAQDITPTASVVCEYL